MKHLAHGMQRATRLALIAGLGQGLLQTYGVIKNKHKESVRE
jgi:hypothetical protein